MKNYWIVFVLALLFSACSGGGGGSVAPANYTVGGTVSGLSGTVVLTNNGGDDLTLTANGAFTFATQVDDGAAYNVQVKTQPAGQTCSAGNNTGTVPGANVTGVTVTCSTNTYSVGGTVSGLSGTVVLTNNGGDDLTLTADGGFTFATAVADGGSYNVQVKTQPSGQTCSAGNNSGTMANADITSVAITCSTNTYSVGGSVSGLSGTVVLTNNGGNDLAVSANGGFTFTTQVAYGGAYNVQVKTQPTGQTCTPGSNTGTMAGANVTGVTVTCSTNTYSVGGSVSGLNGTLVLQNNGGDDKTITSNTVFTFATQVAHGGAYAVTVKSAPSNQNCTVTNGSGTATATADITTVAVTCANKVWVHPASLTDNISPDGQIAYDPQIAMDNSGNAIIVWRQNDGANEQIFKSEYRTGAWTHPSNLTDNISPDGGTASAPQVAMDDNGNAIIVWTQVDGANYQIFKSEYRNGAWTHPSSLADNISPDGQHASDPKIAMDNSGNAIIVWQQNDGANDQIFKSEYRNGAWTHPSSLADNISPDGSIADTPQVAMDNSGNAIIVWEQENAEPVYQTFKSEYRNGAWTHPASLADNISPDGQPAYNQQVALDDNGNAIIVWYQNDGTFDQIFKSEYRNGAWTHPASLADNISPDGQHAVNPQVALDNSGNAIIVWWQSDGVDKQMFKSDYRNGAWTHPASLSSNISPDGGAGEAPYVAMDDNGNAVIVWWQGDGASIQTFKSEYRNGVWTHPASLADNISPDGQSVSGYPRVAMDDNGNAIIVWQQGDGTNDHIFKSEYR